MFPICSMVVNYFHPRAVFTFFQRTSSADEQQHFQPQSLQAGQTEWFQSFPCLGRSPQTQLVLLGWTQPVSGTGAMSSECSSPTRENALAYFSFSDTLHRVTAGCMTQPIYSISYFLYLVSFLYPFLIQNY